MVSERSAFETWFVYQHGPRQKHDAGGDDHLTDLVAKGVAAREMLRVRAEWDARYTSALYAWQAAQHRAETLVTDVQESAQLGMDAYTALAAARVRIAELEARISALIAGSIFPADGADEITVDGVRWVRVPAERLVMFVRDGGRGPIVIE